MEWLVVVDPISEARGGRFFRDPLATRDPHDIKGVARSRPERNVWEDDDHLGVGEELVVTARPLPPLLVPLRQMAKLHPQDTCLDGVEPAVVPLGVVAGFSRLTMVPQHLAAPRQSLVVSR